MIQYYNIYIKLFTDKNHLRDLLDKTYFNEAKDLNDPLIPGLFD